MSIFKNDTKRSASKKPWPKDCVWPEPLWDGNGGDFWDEDLASMADADEVIEELLEIKSYMDQLIEEGRLNEDYSLNEDYDLLMDDSGDLDEPDDLVDPEDLDDPEEQDIDDDEMTVWEPEKGLDYWDDGFDLIGWEDDLAFHMNLLKLPTQEPSQDPGIAIRQVLDYSFINENLLRQAFTRRAFGIEYGVGDSEQLEFIGDSVLNTVLTREIMRQFTDIVEVTPQNPFRSYYDEGEMSRIRAHFVSKEHLSTRAVELGLDRFILCGTGEQLTESAREDMMEALIGAVAADSGWDWSVLESVVDRLICIQIMKPDELLKASWYDVFNAWHQKHFGKMPDYEVYGSEAVKSREPYHCTLRFQIPENDQDLNPCQRADVDAVTRSKAREQAAFIAYKFVVSHGLWINLEESGITPNLENSINQLQELFQKKYLDFAPEYTFEEIFGNKWTCDCICSGIHGFGIAESKTKAKKKAAYMVLERLFK